MTDAILSVLEWINDLMLGMGGRGSALTSTMYDYMPSVYNFSSTIMTTVIMPVAYTILAIFAMLELHHAATRVDGAIGGNQLGAEIVFKVLFKIIICKLVIDVTPMLLDAIFGVTTYLTRQISTLVLSEDVTMGLDLAALEPIIDELGFWTALVVLILCFVIYLITLIAVAFASVIILARFFELYIYYAVAPIPLATLPSEEMSQIGKGFLKSFAATALQGTIIFLILSFYPVLINAAFMSTPIDDIMSALCSVLGYALVLILALFSAGKWAKAVANAM